MIFVQLVIDNSIASDLSPEAFVKHYYLTPMAMNELVKIEVKQGEMGEDGERIQETMKCGCWRCQGLKSNPYAEEENK